MEIAIITLTVMVSLIAAVMLLWPIGLRFFARDYYRKAYAPVELSGTTAQNIPPQHHLTHVPWITSPWQLSQSTSLQMIAASHGIEYPRSNFDFLMAYTYGANHLADVGFSPLGTDPEIGMMTAAPYLSLKRVYAVSSDSGVFLSALRSAIAKGDPVRIALDGAALYAQPGSLGHSIILVGYDARGFEYYETIGVPPSPVQAGERSAGEQGLHVDDSTLLAAVEKYSQRMGYPWRYAMTTFEPAPLQEDLRPVWLMTGRAMAEEIKYGPRLGARVIETLAAKIEREADAFDLSKIRDGIILAAQVRQDNADFLRANFSLHYDLLEATTLMEQAALLYRKVQEDLQDGINSQVEARRVASWLYDAADAERKISEIFIKRGNSHI